MLREPGALGFWSLGIRVPLFRLAVPLVLKSMVS